MKENNSEAKLLTYDQAQALAQALNIKNFEDWKEFYKSEKYEAKLIPLYPELAYKEWKGWDEFLSVKSIETLYMQGVVKEEKTLSKRGRPAFIRMSYEEAREFLKNKNLTYNDWKEYCKTKPDFIPNDPYNYYRNNGWKGWNDFLGYEPTRSNYFLLNQKNKTDPYNERFGRNGQFVSYYKAKDFLKDKGLMQKDWDDYGKFLPNDIPKNPYNVYRNKGWINWYDFLSYEPKMANDFKTRTKLFPGFHFINYEGAKSWIEETKKEYPTLKLNETMWKEFKKPSFIPDYPEIVYIDKGWKGWDDFLGYASSIVQKNDAKKEKITTNDEVSKESFFKRLAKPFLNLLKNETLIIEPKESPKEKEDTSLEEASQRLVEPYFPRKQKEEQKELQDEMNEKLKQQLKDMKDDALQIDSHLMRHEIDDLAYPVAIEPELRTKLIKMFEHWSKFEPEQEKQLTNDLHDLLCRSPDNTKKDDESSNAPTYISEKGLKALLTLFDIKTYPEYMEFRNASPRKDEMPLIPHKHYNNWDGWMAFFNQQTEEKKVNVKVKSKPAKVNINVKKDDEIRTYQDLHPTANYLEQLCNKLKKEFSKEEYHSGNTYYYVSYEEAKKFAHTLSLKSSDEWNIIREDLPHFIPHYPDMEYKEFESWETFLGYKPKPSKPILPTHKKENKETLKPKEKLPPIKYTMNRDGTVSVLSKPPLKALENIDKLAKEHYTQFEKAKELVKKFKFQNEHEYKAYLFKPKDLPENPEQEFAKKGWVDWDDFLGLVKSEES